MNSYTSTKHCILKVKNAFCKASIELILQMRLKNNCFDAIKVEIGCRSAFINSEISFIIWQIHIDKYLLSRLSACSIIALELIQINN